jgi:hypothetical protein
MKTHAQIEALINELKHERELDPKKSEHHAVAIYTLCLALDETKKPTVINEML